MQTGLPPWYMKLNKYEGFSQRKEFAPREQILSFKNSPHLEERQTFLC